jgi:hypothetical protein
MKTTKIFGLILVTLLLFSACQEQAVRYTQNSPEIDHLKAAIADYEAGNWEGYMSHYADTAKIYHNTDDKPMSPKESSEFFTDRNKNYSAYGFVKDEGDSEMVVTDEGETWVNYWGLWNGTLSANNQTLTMPVHLTAQFVDGKIVKEYGYFDTAPIMTAMMEIEAAKKAADTLSGKNSLTPSTKK